MDSGSILSTGGKLQINLAVIPLQGATAELTVLSEAQVADAQRR